MCKKGNNINATYLCVGQNKFSGNNRKLKKQTMKLQYFIFIKNIFDKRSSFSLKEENSNCLISHNRARTKFIRKYTQLFFVFINVVTALIFIYFHIKGKIKKLPNSVITFDLNKIVYRNLLPEMCIPAFKQSQELLNEDTSETFQFGQYYSNWSPYSPNNFLPQDIDMRYTTHIYYSFIAIDEKTGMVYLEDKETDINFKTEEKNDCGLIMQLNHMRRNNDYFKNKVMPFKANEYKHTDFHKHLLENQKNFKLIMSVGGWSQKDAFKNLSNKKDHLDNFINSCIDLVLANGFDGIDIDWEFPKGKNEIKAYVDIFKRLRDRFERIEIEIFNLHNSIRSFSLSAAIPCNKDTLKTLNLKEVDKFIDYFNLMAYDLAGEWSSKTAYHSNLFFDINNKDNLNINSAVTYMLKELRLPSKKIILGMPLYGRSFTNVTPNAEHVIGVPFKGVGSGFDSSSPGIWPYHAIVDLKYEAYYDKKLVAAYVYNAKKKHLIVFDDHHCIRRKAEYIKEMGLGGGFFWEANGERHNRFNERLLPHFSDYSCLSFNKTSDTIWNTKEMLNYYDKYVHNIVVLANNNELAHQAKKTLSIMKLPEQ